MKRSLVSQFSRVTLLAAALAAMNYAHGQVAVSTYHNDSQRTGWNQHETVLTQSNVNATHFGLLKVVSLDDQVDAAPLVVPNVTINGAKHTVVYVATENNTIYAIDGSSGAVLMSKNFGPAVPQNKLPGNCSNNGPRVGINGTPVVDVATNTMYVLVFTLNGTTFAYHIHAINLSTLADKVPPVLVTGSHKLDNGSTYTFDAAVQRQRPGLLEANSNIYTAFGSFCDVQANLSRGWLLGWKTGTLTPLAANDNRLNNLLATSPNSFFLSSIWMSGYGPSTDAAGNIYFVTGNSDFSGTTYNSVNNISETVAKVSPALTSLVDFFTPADESSLEKGDVDFGSGGAMVLPPQPGQTPNMLVAAGKDGNLYLMNQANMGKFHSTNQVLGTFPVGACWCGPSYFSDGVNHVVTSGGAVVTLWNIKTSTTAPATLVKAGSANFPGSVQDGGFFTSISSNGAANPIIWAVSRPAGSSNTSISLIAFKAVPTLPVLYQHTAGSWPSINGNANIVPVVANGKVYVASYKQLAIFGLTPPSPTVKFVEPELHSFAVERPPLPEGIGSEVFGTIQDVNGNKVMLKTRTATVEVDVSSALKNQLSVGLLPGRAVHISGNYDNKHVLHAEHVLRAKAATESWPEDR